VRCVAAAVAFNKAVQIARGMQRRPEAREAGRGRAAGARATPTVNGAVPPNFDPMLYGVISPNCLFNVSGRIANLYLGYVCNVTKLSK